MHDLVSATLSLLQSGKLNINISTTQYFVYIVMMNNENMYYNLSQYLSLYSQVYPRYVPRITYNEGFKPFQKVVNTLFYNMCYFIGIPQALLNCVVFFTVILITKHPSLALKSNTTINGHRSKHIYVPR